MKPETLAELDCIASAICDDLCRWPRVLKDEDALEEKCAACRPLVDMANMVERLEASSPRHTHRCRDRSRLRGGECEARLGRL